MLTQIRLQKENMFMIALSVTGNQHGKTPAAIWCFINQKSDFLLDEDKRLKRTKREE